MSWTSIFVIYRIGPGGSVTEVFQADDIKKAKYWLTYIAKAGDVLCKTPMHPKHSKSCGTAEYWSHREETGKLSTDEQRWKDFIQKAYGSYTFPEGSLGVSEAAQ